MANAIVMMKFHLIIFLLNLNLLLYSHGMEPKQKSTMPLSAAAEPFIPQPSQALSEHDHLIGGKDDLHENWEVTRRSVQRELFQRGHQQYIDNLSAIQDKYYYKDHSISRQSLAENNVDKVEIKIRKLPDDPFNMKTSPKSRKAPKKKWRQRVEEKLRENRKGQKNNSRKRLLVEEDELDKGRMQERNLHMKMISHPISHVKEDLPTIRHTLNQIGKERPKTLEKIPNQMAKGNAVILGENESKNENPSKNSHSKDESENESSRNDRDHSNESSGKSGEFEKAKSDHEEAAILLTSNTSTMTVNSPPNASSSDSSDSKSKLMVTDEKKVKADVNEYNARVDSIVKLVQKLEHDKFDCMDTKNKKKKERKIYALMVDYLKIISELEEYSELYSEDQKNIVYFGDLLNRMNAKESAIDNEHLKRAMEETLAYLAENDLIYLDDMFENIRRLMGFIEVYYIGKNEEAKAEMIEWYESTVKSEIFHVFHYIFVGLLPDLILTRHALYGGLFLFSKATPNLHQEFLEARQTVDKYMDILYGSEEENLTMSTTELFIEQLRKDERNQVPVSLLTVSRASGSKNKAAMTEFSRERIPGLNSQIESIIDSIQKLDHDRIKCMGISDVDEKKMKLAKLMNDYNTIMDNLQEFSETYYRKNDTIMYIGDLFERMERDHHKASLIDMLRIMQESLEYLDENLKNTEHDVMQFDKFLENVRILNEHLVAYDEAAKTHGSEDPVTKQAIVGMIEWYRNNVDGEFRHVLRYLHVGLHSAKMSGEMIYFGLKKLLLALPSRKKDLTRVIRTISNYYRKVIIQFGQIGDGNKSQIETVDKMNKDIEFVVKKIAALERTKEICSETDDFKNKERLKICYQIVMNSLTSFAKDYELKRNNTSDFFVDVIDWMLVDLYTGMEDVHADDVNTTMRSSLSLLQGNTLLHNIDRLKAKQETCEKLAESLNGYTVLKTRAALSEVREFYIKEVEANINKAISYILIGIKDETGEQLTRKQALAVLAGLSETALPRYRQDFQEAIHKITVFNNFLRKASMQEIGENLMEYVANILQINFDPKDGTHNLDKLADKLEYPQIYTDGLNAIDEFKKQLLKEEEEKKSSVDSPAESSSADVKSGKKKANGKTVEASASNTINFGPINNSNWKEVLNEARNLIRYMSILEKMIVEEIRPRTKVYEQKVYLRAWAILFRDKFASIINKWKNEFCNIKNKKFDQNDTYSILKFYSEGISNFAVHHRKLNKVKRKMIRVALEELNNQIEIMGHRAEAPDEVDEAW